MVNWLPHYYTCIMVYAAYMHLDAHVYIYIYIYLFIYIEQSVHLPFWYIGGFGSHRFESNPGRVKPMTLKLIVVTSQPGAQHYQDRARAGWPSVSIMQMSESWCQMPGLPVWQHYKVTMHAHVTSQYLSRYDLRCCQNAKQRGGPQVAPPVGFWSYASKKQQSLVSGNYYCEQYQETIPFRIFIFA